MKTKVAILTSLLFSAVALFAGAYTASSGLVKSLTTTQRISSVVAYNSAGADRFLQLFDAGSLPVNGTVPLMTVRIPTQSTGSLEFTGTLKPTTGFVAAISMTDSTLTITGSSEALIMFIYP